MATTLALRSERCLAWMVEEPFGESCQSPAFTYQNHSWLFKVRGVLKDGIYFFYLTKVTTSSFRDFTVSASLESADGEILLSCAGRRRTVTNNCRSLLTYITKTSDEPRSVTLVCHFEGDSTVRLKSQTRVSTRNSRKASFRERDHPPTRPFVQPSCLETLSTDYEKLLDDKKHSDVLLNCGDQSFSAHRNILSARSEVFAAMFRNKMSESLTGVVNIPDVKPAVLENFLRYIYSGRVDSLTVDAALDFYQVADKYAVCSLKEMCATFVGSNLTEDATCTALLLAERHGDSQMLETALSYTANRREFLISERWNCFADEHPRLAVRVYKNYVKRQKM